MIQGAQQEGQLAVAKYESHNYAHQSGRDGGAAAHEIESTEISVGNKFMTEKKGHSGHPSLTIPATSTGTPNNNLGYSGGTFSPEFKDEKARNRGMEQPALS